MTEEENIEVKHPFEAEGATSLSPEKKDDASTAQIDILSKPVASLTKEEIAKLAEQGLVPVASGTFDIRATFFRSLKDDPELTMPVAAIESLVELLAQSETSTVSEFMHVLRLGIDALKSSIHNTISLSAGCDLFLRYCVRSLSQNTSSLPRLTSHLLSNARLFVSRAKESRERIATLGAKFITDNCTILTHSHSRVVMAILLEGVRRHIRFKVIVTEGWGGEKTAQKLREKGVPVATIKEGAVGYAMSAADMVLLGAEGVVENGGVVNVLGTYQIAVLAKNAQKPFYIVAETFKFLRMYPLDGLDLPVKQKIIHFTTEQAASGKDDGPKEAWQDCATDKHQVDFTPPSLVNAIITEGGVLTPGSVSEELIKIWY